MCSPRNQKLRPRRQRPRRPRRRKLPPRKLRPRRLQQRRLPTNRTRSRLLSRPPNRNRQVSTFLSPRSRRLLPHPNPHLNPLPLPLLRRSRLHRSVSFRHRVVLAPVAKHRLLPLRLRPRLLPPLLLRLQPRHLLPRRHRQHPQLESRPRLRHALRCRSVLRPRRRVSRFRLLPADVPRFLLRVSPSHRPPACVAKHLLLVRVLAVVLVVPVPVVLALVVVLVAALLVVVPAAEA